MNLKDQIVDFRVCDVHIPQPGKVLEELFGSRVLRGRVLDLANAGPDGEQFAIVQVEGARDPLIVPVMKILGIGGVR